MTARTFPSQPKPSCDTNGRISTLYSSVAMIPRKPAAGGILYRGIVRKVEASCWAHISYKIAGRLGQAATLNGLEGISPGDSLERIPYGIMRGFRALDTRDPSHPYFQHAVAQGQIGMDAKFVIQDHFVVDMTANPDVSQVESDDPHISVNQRFCASFPEQGLV